MGVSLSGWILLPILLVTWLWLNSITGFKFVLTDMIMIAFTWIPYYYGVTIEGSYSRVLNTNYNRD